MHARYALTLVLLLSSSLISLSGVQAQNSSAPAQAPRARELGVPFDGTSGRFNAITDVPGVEVGFKTLIVGEGRLTVGKGPVRTGVTAILPRGKGSMKSVFAGYFAGNGNGDMTGTHWIEESGVLETPILITNTGSVGVVRDAAVAWLVRRKQPGEFWYPVTAETADWPLNDIKGQHVSAQDAWDALNSAAGGPLAEGNVGGGTGMICHEFKGGIGTASRKLATQDGGYTIGVLVQANHGRRRRLSVNGADVGRILNTEEIPPPRAPELHAAGAGSIIAVVATNAPLLPHQCARLAQRAGLGVARTGGVGENDSGDLFLAFATGNGELRAEAVGREVPVSVGLRMVLNERMSAMFDAVVEATEEAIVNALLAAETMTGRDGVIAHRLPPERLVRILD
jgi:D-aminopeptidase